MEERPMFGDLSTSPKQASNGTCLKYKIYPREDESFEAYLGEPTKITDGQSRKPKFQWKLPGGAILFYKTFGAARIFQAKKLGATFQARLLLPGAKEDISVCVKLL